MATFNSWSSRLYREQILTQTILSLFEQSPSDQTGKMQDSEARRGADSECKTSAGIGWLYVVIPLLYVSSLTNLAGLP